MTKTKPPAATGRLDLAWLDTPDRRALAAALVAHRARLGRGAAAMSPQHCAFVDAVLDACDTDADRVTLPEWPRLGDQSPALDATLDVLEKAASAHADWADRDDRGPALLRRLREALIGATGWTARPQPRRFGEPAGVLR